MPTTRIMLFVIGLLLDLFGFFLVFTAYFALPFPQWELGVALLVIGIILNLVGLVA